MAAATRAAEVEGKRGFMLLGYTEGIAEGARCELGWLGWIGWMELLKHLCPRPRPLYTYVHVANVCTTVVALLALCRSVVRRRVTHEQFIYFAI